MSSVLTTDFLIRNNWVMAGLLDEKDVTPREREVLSLLRKRSTNAEIADRLYISVRTVESHVSSLLTKLGARDRLELAALVDQADRPRPLHNLPRLPTSFVGRGSELAELDKLVRGSRLVTVVGPAGVGKTRLALEAAAVRLDEHPDGAWLVELAPLADPELVAAEVTSVLGCSSVPDLSPIEALVRCTESLNLLLVLDNCEHQAEAAAATTEALLKRTPHLKVLATSRQPLGVPGEVVMTLEPLAIPALDASGDELSRSDAVRLFSARAEAARPGFRVTKENASHVITLCRSLDGLPLALELAASRLRSFTPAQLAARLDDRLRILAAPSTEARHRTLEAAIEWSYDLLSSDERLLLRRLSVFAGSLSLSSAEEVCSDDRLARGRVLELLPGLVEKSLVDFFPSGESYRYRLLESIRLFAWERLEERSELARRHAAHLMQFAELAESELRGPNQGSWLHRLTVELLNLRRALEWTIETGEAESALRIVAALELFWDYGDLRREGITWVHRTLEAFPGAPTVLRLRVMLTGAWLMEPWDTQTAIRLAEEASELAETAGETWRMRARLSLGSALVYDRSRSDEVRQSLESAAVHFESTGDRWRVGLSFLRLGVLVELEEAIECLEKAGSCFAQAGDQVQLGNVLYFKAAKLLRLGSDLARAASWAEQAVEIAEELGSQQEMAHARSLEAIVALRRGHWDRTVALSDECLAVFRRVGDVRCMARMVTLKGVVALQSGEMIAGEGYLREAIADALQAEDLATVGECLDGLGSLAEGREAVRLHGSSSAQRAAAGVPMNVSGISYEERLAELRRQIGDEAFLASWDEGLAFDPHELH